MAYTAPYICIVGSDVRGSLITVGELMGHEDEKQTQKYAHLAVPHLEGAMELLETKLLSKQMVNKTTNFPELADYKEEKSSF